MKPSDLPKEKPRVDLNTLPPEIELKATGEAMQEAAQGKTGGLVIAFATRDGQSFKQKYSAMHSQALIDALDQLKVKDTVDLQKSWYQYKMTNFRMGFPRYIPVKKL